MAKNRNSTVDIAKYLAALLVIGIHTALFSDLNDTLYFVVVQIICRVAVPFFAVCTGYFIGRNLAFREGGLVGVSFNTSEFIQRGKSIALLYFSWTCLYLVFSILFWIEIGWFSPMAFVDYAFASLTAGSHYHLWYLLYLLYSLPMVYLFLRWIPARCQWLLILVCWAIAVFSYTYKSLLPENILPSLGALKYFSMFPILPPLILLGVQISKESKEKRQFYAFGFVISFACLIAEAFTLRHFGIEKVSYIICSLPTAYFLFHLILEISSSQNAEKAKYAAPLGSISILVYCIHPMFIETVGKKIGSSVWSYLVVVLMSTATGYVFYLMKSKKIIINKLNSFARNITTQ